MVLVSSVKIDTYTMVLGTNLVFGIGNMHYMLNH